MRGVKTGKGHYALLVGMGLVLTCGCAFARAQQAEQQPQAPPSPSQNLQPQDAPPDLNQSQQPPQGPPSPSQIQQPPAEQSQMQQAPGEAEALHVLVGQSLEVSSPAPIKRFSVANPGIIDAVEENPNQILVNGKAPGSVSLVVWDETGQSQEFYVNVDPEGSGLTGQFGEALPDGPVGTEVPKKRAPWVFCVVIASIGLVVGAILSARRKPEPYLNKFDLRVVEVASATALDEASLPEPSLNGFVPQVVEVTSAEALNEPASLEPNLPEFDLQAPEMGLEGRNEPAVTARPISGAEEHPVEEVITENVTRQAPDLVKLVQDLGERWSRQIEEQVAAALVGMREEMKNSGRVVDESVQRLAALAESKLASLSQATQHEYAQQIAQAFQEHAQVLREAADENVKSIKQAAEQAIAELQAAQQTRETSFLAQASAAEERLTGMSLALYALERRVGALVEELQGQGAKQVEDLEKTARDLGGRWSQQFHEQADAAVEKLQEEVKNSGRVVEESKQQLASLAEAQLASFSQIAADTTAGLEVEQQRLKDQYETFEAEQKRLRKRHQTFEAEQVRLKYQHEAFEAEQKRLKSQYETSRRELVSLFARRSTEASFSVLPLENRPRRRWVVSKVAIATGMFLLMTVSLLGTYLWTVPVMQLKPGFPAEFVDQNPNWGATRRVREQEVALAYWRLAVESLQARYPFGSELPTEPPTEFQVGTKYAPPGGAKPSSETRDYYWQKLRRIWVQPEFWVASPDWDAQLASRVRRVLEELH